MAMRSGRTVAVDLHPGSTVKVVAMTAPTTGPTVPNHHGDHPGFSGVPGLVAGLTMVLGRRQVARLAADLAGLRPGQHVVDVGCGPGAAVRVAASRGATVTGVDPAAVMLGMARWLTRGRTSVTFVEGTAASLPLGDASADVVWSIATVHHWPEIEAGLAEVRRVLVEGGTFLVVERGTDPSATGLATHGWTDLQAEVFGAACRTAGFASVDVAGHRAGRSTQLVVTATR
jgi:ubiquinone/menaquinone biosynthesis C-methylase UbiE